VVEPEADAVSGATKDGIDEEVKKWVAASHVDTPSFGRQWWTVVPHHSIDDHSYRFCNLYDTAYFNYVLLDSAHLMSVRDFRPSGDADSNYWTGQVEPKGIFCSGCADHLLLLVRALLSAPSLKQLGACN
jgi:hypothetical protein